MKPKKTFKYLLKKGFSFFIQGLIYIAPISITIFVLYKIFVFLDSLMPSEIPGLGIVISVVLITLLGFLGSSFIVRPIFRYLDSIFQEIPFFKIIYTSIKDFLYAFVGARKKFSQPVLVKISSDTELYRIGFLTRKDMNCLKSEKKLVAVYLPHSYNFSGNLFFVPAENVTPLDLPPSEVLKFTVSGGITDIRYDVKDNENENSF